MIKENINIIAGDTSAGKSKELKALALFLLKSGSVCYSVKIIAELVIK